MGVPLLLSGNVLVPRPETELLARRACALMSTWGDTRPIVIDMCCGSGNLALALAAALPDARVFAADLTDGAVETARLNVRELGFGDRVTVRQGDLFAALDRDGLDGRAAMIVCNPPYISSARLAGDSAYLLAEEPREAFDGGPYGIGIQQRLVREAPRFLQNGGHLLFEFGVGQQKQAMALLTRARAYTVLEPVLDEAGLPRVAVARMTGSPA